MRVKIYRGQSTVICDTLSRKDPAIVILQAIEATPVFMDQDRANLDGNLDAGGNPQGGWFLTNASPVAILLGPKFVLWGRAGADTFVEVQVIEQRLEVNSVARSSTHQPAKPPPVHTGRLPSGDQYPLRRF